jgi:hypothetical protein
MTIRKAFSPSAPVAGPACEPTIVFAQQASALGNLAVAAAGCGVLYWMAGVARDRGKRMEPDLFKAWGGKPSMQLLRHRNEAIDPVTKARLHTLLAARLGAAFPTAAQEAQEPGEADRLYESATRWLLEQTRDTSKHSLLFTENISYGFRRNMLGMCWVGLTAAVLAAIWLVLDTTVAPPTTWADLGGLLITMPTEHRLGVTVCAATAGVWILGVSRDRVRAAAFSYAERLVAACEALADRPSAGGVSGSEAAKQNLGGAGAGPDFCRPRSQPPQFALWNG